MRRPFVAGNWKMHKTVEEALELVTELKRLLADVTEVEIAVAPPFTALYAVGQALAGSQIGLAAQNVFWEREGAYTGEVSPRMLQALGCKYVIIGHSERRQHFGETDETIKKRIRAAWSFGLRPICCIGETLEQREANRTLAVVERQLRAALEAVPEAEVERLVIAYEPVWAIGTGKTASPGQANEVHSFIRELLRKRYRQRADRVRIQYGGSVSPENIAALMAQPEIDGALVGGASLKAETFSRIVRAAGR